MQRAVFCLQNFTNDYGFRPLTLLLHCLVHPHCYCFLESKEGTVRWTTPDPFFHARDTQLHKDSFALYCAIGVRQDSCPSTFIGVQSSCTWLSGAQGGDQAFGRHVRRGCSAPAPCVYGISQLSAVKKKVGIGISLDQPGMF